MIKAMKIITQTQPLVVNKNRWSKVKLLLLVILICLIGLILLKRVAISDWVRLLGYSPPSSIAQLANDDTMNSYTKHLFYLNRPQLLSTVSTFRQKCPEDEDVIVLGCYHSGQNGIFIYNVQDPTLAGVQQVTAAHEVLHSVYARLSSKDRIVLDNELQSFYQHGLSDPQVIAEVKLYQKTEPTDVYDEMSCTFGTELASLPADLNAYYAKYFTNRMAIISYEQSYHDQLTNRQNTITSYDSQLSSLKGQIDSDEAQLDSQQNSIESQENTLNSERQTDPEAYNAAVPVYNQQVDAYNQLVGTVQSLIAQYNQLVVTRNSLAIQLDNLDSALDTRLSTKTTQ